MFKYSLLTFLACGLLLPTLTLPDSNTNEIYTLRVGDILPEVDFLAEDGRQVAREDLLGRVTVLDFWATWCAPCIAAFPTLNELERQFPGITFYSITYETPGKIQPVLAQHSLETPLGFDRDFSTFRAFRAWGIPTTYIFNPDGELVSALHPADLSAAVLETVLAGEIPEVEQAAGWPDAEGAEEHFRSLVD